MRSMGIFATALLACGASAAFAAPVRPPIVGLSHITVYAADAAKTEAFYMHDLGAVKGTDPEDTQGVRYYFSPSQFVEVLPLPSGAGINRLDHVAFTTDNAEAMRAYLEAAKVAVPSRVTRGYDGSEWFKVRDPEGKTVEFVQPPEKLPAVPPGGLSVHIIHVGYTVQNRALEDAFFREILGFRPYWFGGTHPDTPSWVSQQVPNGTDWLEYMMVPLSDAAGQPVELTQARLGVLDHFSLGVANMEAAYTLLWNGERVQSQSGPPKIGLDAKWQLNLIDPDGTRAEVMEFHAIGKPCCSPFTASDPDR